MFLKKSINIMRCIL